MIKKSESIEPIVVHDMKGGKGDVLRYDSVKPGEYDSPAKVVARLVLRPGVSIGFHTHTGDEEIMTILAGTGTYTDAAGSCVVGAGDVTVCRDGEAHSIENTAGSGNLEIMAVVIGTNR